MAIFSMRVTVIKRQARSCVAAAAYRSGERLYDERQDRVHDYSRRGGVVHTELMFPANAPEWLNGIGRAAFWNAVDAAEKRRDAQTARELYVSIPRELGSDERLRVVRDFVRDSFVARGMCADICWHLAPASDGGEDCHAHIMLTTRPLSVSGFGKKERHEYVIDPEGRTYPDGRPVMVESRESWNSAQYYEKCRARWEGLANEALQKAGHEARIDRRSFLERGIARIPQPMLGIAYHMKTVFAPAFRAKWGQFHMAKHYQELERRVKDAFAGPGNAPVRARDQAHRTRRWFDWFDRQLARLTPLDPNPSHEPPRGTAPEMER